MVTFINVLEDNTCLRNKPKTKYPKWAWWLLAVVLFMPMHLFASEVRGVVDFNFETTPADTIVVNDIPITIALFPLDGQVLPDTQANTHQMIITNRRINPVYLTIQRGDNVQLVNNDALIHQFQLLENTTKSTVVLASKGKSDASSTVSFKQNGRTHLFCKIHAGTYGRIDVIDTPYIKVINGPGDFEFKDIEAGRWQVRVSAPGSDLAVEVAEAFTAPPPVKVALKYHVRKTRDTFDTLTRKLNSLFPK